MNDLHPVDLLLWASAVFMWLLMVVALRGTFKLRTAIRGRRGFDLTSVLVVVLGVVTLAQFIAVVNATLIVIGREHTLDARVLMFMTENVIKGLAVIYAFWRVREIAAREDASTSGRDTIGTGTTAEQQQEEH